MSYPQASSAYNNGHYSYIPSNTPTQNKYITQQGTTLIPKTQRRPSPYDPLNDSDPFASIGLYVVPPTQQSPDHSRAGLPVHQLPYRDAHTSQHNVSSTLYHPFSSGSSTPLQQESMPFVSRSRHSSKCEAVSLTVEDYGGDGRRPQSAARYGLPSTSTDDKGQHGHQKTARSSRLNGIPKDQMRRFRLQDIGTGPTARSRTGLPGSDAQPDANGGRKGKGRAEPSLEENQVAAKRKREADRQQAYRDGVGSTFDELHAETYPDEEKSALARSDHAKQQCMRDAARQLRTLRTKNAALEEKASSAVRREKESSDALIAAERDYWQRIGQLHQVVVDLEKRLQARPDHS